MKHILSLIAVAVASSQVTAATDDNENYLLHFDRPARYFEEAVVIGNGNLGAIIYGGVSKDSLSLNDITLWTGEPERGVTNPDAYKAIPEIRAALDREDYRAADSLQRKAQGHYSENYQPLGTLTITYPGRDAARMHDYNRLLSVRHSVAATMMKGPDDGHFATTYFASAPDSVIVLRLLSATPTDAVISLTSLLPHKTRATGGEIISDGYAAYMSLPSYTSFEEKLRYDENRGTPYCTIIKAVPADGYVASMPDGSLEICQSKDVTLYITNVTGFNGFDRDPRKEGRDYRTLAQARIDRAVAKGFNDILADHLADYRELYDRVSIDLGTTPDSIASLPTDVQLKRYTDLKEVNPDLEELYFNYGRYLLISCARTPAVPANLQGLWNEYILPPWSSNYTTNINVEENYWPAEVTALGELHATSLIPWIKNLSEGVAKTARHYFGVDRGWALGHNSDIWAMTNPVGLGGGDPNWANWGMGSAWLASHIWEHYMFSQDKDFLKEYYPVLKGAAEFFIGSLVDKDGELITSPSTSPENKYVTPEGYHGATLYGSVSDLAMGRQCLLDTRDAAIALGVDDALVAEIDTVLSKLRPYHIGANGNLQEWYHDWADQDPQHRHQSHLYGLYPGHHISVDETPELAKAASRTLEIKGDNTTGWSTGWRVNLLARLRENEKAYAMYRRLLRYVSPDRYDGPDKRTGGGTYPNLLDAHAPFQIDGNFGGTAGVAEMLMQSTPDRILILPALPAEWRDGYVAGLRARGGFIVDLAWDGGKVSALDIHSPAGGNTTVVLPGGKTYDISLAPGETWSLTE